jgi:hypothetical protein
MKSGGPPTIIVLNNTSRRVKEHHMLPVRFSFEHTCLHRSGIEFDHFGVDKEGARPVSESAASKNSIRKLDPNPANHKLRLAKQHHDSDSEVSAYFKRCGA